MTKVRHVVAFVRHPVTYYESVWKFLKRHSKNEREGLTTRWSWHPHASAACWYTDRFDDWVFLMLEKEPMWCTRIVECFVGPAGGEFCDYIGRTRTLVDDFCDAMRHFGYAGVMDEKEQEVRRLKKANLSDPVPIEWSRDLLARVLETERLVIERFYGENCNVRLYGSLAQKVGSVDSQRGENGHG